MLFSNIFLPNIGNKRIYSGIIILFLNILYCINLKYKVSYEEKILVKVFIFQIIFYNFTLLLNNNITSIFEVFKVYINILIPLLSFHVGRAVILENKNDKVNIFKSIKYILILEIIAGVSVISNLNINNILIKLYSSFEKYSQFSNGGIRRAVGTIGNPNNYGSVIAILSLLLLNYYFEYENKNNIFKKLFIIIMQGLTLFCIILSQSKTALIIYFLLFFYIILKIGKKNKLLIIFTVIILFILYNILKNSLLINIINSYFDINDNKTFGGRTYIWGEYLNLYRNSNLIHKIFGFGENYILNYDTSVDNNYLAQLISFGIFGLSIYVGKYIILFLLNKKNSFTAMINIIIIGMMIIDFTSANNQLMNIEFYLLLGLFYSINSNNEYLL